MVEDFAQDALLRITGRLHSFRGESRFLTWALAVAVRVAVSELRRARWRDISIDEMAEAGRVIRGPFGPAEHRIAAEQLAATVARLVQTELTAKRRQALVGGTEWRSN
jgi:RNA polymerase sigma-70 factor (ECF subfamily)